MSTTLAKRYARYGTLASITLAALEELDERAAQGHPAIPRGEELVHIKELREVLAASARGGVTAESAEPVRQLASRTPMSRRSVDDSTVVKSVVPSNWRFETFVPRADSVLETVISDGLSEEMEDRDFYDGPLKAFLQRLAHSNQSVSPSSRRGGRRRYSLG